jgi:hypothetical protein
MNLAWIRYNSSKGDNHALFLILGDRGDKVAMLKSNALDAGEQHYIRDNLIKLSVLSLDDRIKWFNEHCPRSMKDAFRLIHRDKLHILDSYTPQQGGSVPSGLNKE